MNKVQFVWLIILSVLYAVLIEFQVDTQHQLNSIMNAQLKSLKKREKEGLDFAIEKSDSETDAPT